MIPRSTEGVGAVEHLEAEVAAALLIETMRRNDDAFQAVSFTQLADWAYAPTGRWLKVLKNPFVEPDFDELVDSGWAEWVGPVSEGRGRSMQFTAKGIARLEEKAWVFS